MSCGKNRAAFLKYVETETGSSAEALEAVFEAGRNRQATPAIRLIASAKTTLLFSLMRNLGFPLPAHGTKPTSTSRAALGYAALYEKINEDYRVICKLRFLEDERLKTAEKQQMIAAARDRKVGFPAVLDALERALQGKPEEVRQSVMGMAISFAQTPVAGPELDQWARERVALAELHWQADQAARRKVA